MSVLGSEPSDAERKILIKEFHSHVDQLLNQEDKDFLFYALKQYNTYRNVAKLVLALTSCLDGPEKLDLLPHIRSLIPLCDMKKYDRLAPYHQMANPPGSAVKKRGGAVRNIRINKSNGASLGLNIRGGWEYGLGVFVSSVDAGSLSQQCGLEWITHVTAVKVLKSNNVLNLIVSSIEKLPGHQLNKGSYVWVSTEGQQSSDADNLPVKERYKKVSVSVNWQKDGLGISLRGGREYGIGLFISCVDNESRAAKCGLKVGDQIVEVNGHSFVDALHDEAVAILKSYQNLILTIKSIGKVPTIPPSEIQRSASLHHPQNPPHAEAVRKHSFHSSQSPVKGTISNKQEKPVAQVKPKVKQLPKHQLEKMSSTEWPETTASTPSLQFSSSPVNQVRRAQSMKVRALRSQSTPEVPQEEKPRPKSSLPFKPSPLLLSSSSPPPKSTNNKKRSNFLEKEEFKFNSLPRGFKLQQSKAFIEGMGTQVMYASASHISAKSLLLERASKILKETEYVELKEKLEQYQNGMKVELFVTYLLPMLDTVEKLTLLTEVRSVLDPPDLATFDELVSPKEAEMLMERSDGQSHGSLLTAIKAHGGVNSLRKASTESKQENELPELGPFGSTEALGILNRATSNSQNNSARRLESFIAWEDDPTVAERRRNLRKKYPAASEVVVIEIDKNCSTIGLTVEGGVDTSQKEIRISTVLPGGAAHQHGFLKAGYEILEVDGEVICGMKHRDACTAIHKAFKSKKPKLEMTVVPIHVHNTP